MFAIGIAVADIIHRGFDRLPFFIGGAIATVGVNYIYVFVVRKGAVREAIDISEAPIVALSLILPPGEALIAFVLGSFVGDLRRDSATVKKVFNLSVRTVAAALLLSVVRSAAGHPALAPTSVGAAVLGALGYSALSAFVVAVLIASIGGPSVGAALRTGLGMRAVVWASAVAIGLTSARLALHAPLALAGIFGGLLIVGMTARACSEAEQDRDRLERVLTASAEIQSAADEEEQESALLAAAEELLPWREVSLRELPPQDGEAGGRLTVGTGNDLWLVARPQPGSDPLIEADERVIDALSSAGGAAIERAQIRDELLRQSRLDPLTGLANRRRLDEELSRILDGTSGQGVAVLLIDLDMLKRVNDKLGHDMGDAVLQTVGSRLLAAVRNTDLVARVGGDEFVVVLQDVSEGIALRVASVIQSKLDEPADLNGWRLPTPASIGVAIGGVDGGTSDELIRMADDRMYEAKRRRSEAHELVAAAIKRRHGDVDGHQCDVDGPQCDIDGRTVDLRGPRVIGRAAVVSDSAASGNGASGNSTAQ
jgi:diguanylate cyclase (GGDEF)-like protein